jgi:hypothetical protein
MPSAVDFLFFSMYRAELTAFPASKNTVMQTLCVAQNTVERILPADGSVLNFFERGDEACLYCMFSHFSSASK